MNHSLVTELNLGLASPFKEQLLKWVGNKQRFAHEIVSVFPKQYNQYFEPFLGSGAVLATLRPKKALGADIFHPLIEIWTTLKVNPNTVKEWYMERWQEAEKYTRKDGYERIKASYNSCPNGADFLFLSRACYGGVIRFRQSDGYMSTPSGPHKLMPPITFSKRVDNWHERIKHADFACLDYKEVMRQAKKGDLVYCDPPYHYSQKILYGGHSFQLEELLSEIEMCKNRGVFVALSIDGIKKTGNKPYRLPIPPGLFEEEIFVNVGRSMLKRFQMEGQTLHNEVVFDRLLLTYKL